MEAQNKFKSQ